MIQDYGTLFDRDSEESTRCPTCGAKVVRYKHRLNKGLVVGLHKAFLAAEREVGRPVGVSEMGLSYCERCNFQKLKYWGVTQKNPKARGEWYVTELGKAFLMSQEPIPLWIQTYRNEPVACAPNLVLPLHVLPRYRWDQIDWYVATQEAELL